MVFQTIKLSSKLKKLNKLKIGHVKRILYIIQFLMIFYEILDNNIKNTFPTIFLKVSGKTMGFVDFFLMFQKYFRIFFITFNLIYA